MDAEIGNLAGRCETKMGFRENRLSKKVQPPFTGVLVSVITVIFSPS